MTQITRRDYSPTLVQCPVTRLPFVKDIRVAPRKQRRSFWAVEPTTDYGLACDLGREYAAHYIQYVVQRTDGLPLLGWIVDAMSEADGLCLPGVKRAGAAIHGYGVGFFGFIEDVLHIAMAGRDPFLLAQRQADRIAEGLRRAQAEADRGERS